MALEGAVDTNSISMKLYRIGPEYGAYGNTVRLTTGE